MSAAAPRTNVRAFGVDLSLGFPLVALDGAEGGAEPAGATRLDLVDDAELERRRGSAASEVVGEMLNLDGSLSMRVHANPDSGYLLDLPPLGRYGAGPDGRTAECVPPDLPDWQWQRGLVGQLLPLLSLLQGHEVLHASVLARDGHAIALSGPPGAGKSSLALQLALAGADIVAEDTVALTVDGDGLLAEPGVALVSLRLDEAERIGTARLAEVGEVLGTADKLLVRLRRAASAVPLRALYLLEPGGRLADGIRPAPAPSLFELMGDLYVPYVETPEARMLHFQVAGILADSVRLFHVPVDREAGPTRVAEAIGEHAWGTAR